MILYIQSYMAIKLPKKIESLLLGEIYPGTHLSYQLRGIFNTKPVRLFKIRTRFCLTF